MSSIVAPLTLNLGFSRENERASNHGLAKEASTVGELISFTERPQPLSLDKTTSRLSSSLSDISTVGRRRNSIARQDSLGSVFGASRLSRASITSPDKRSNRTSLTSPDKRGNRTFLASPDKRGNRKSLASPDKRFTDDASPQPRAKLSRRESMLNVLREDLQQIPCLEALRLHSVKRNDDEVFTVENSTLDSESEDGRSSKNKFGRFSRRSSKMSFGRRESRRSTSEHVCISEADMRKLEMLYTLNKMGPTKSQLNARKTSLSDGQTGEVAILDAAYGAGNKRGSITTRILLKTSRKTENRMALTDRSEIAKSVRRMTGSLDTKSATKQPEVSIETPTEKSQRVLDMLKNAMPAAKLPPIGGQDKGTTKPEAAVKDAFVGLRRKLRRKKMRPLEVFRKRAKFVVLLLRAWKIHSNAINESLIANNDSLDMMTRGNNTDLMFDITKFKAVKEAKVSQEAKRILQKKPFTRTEDEKHYIQVFLRNYKSIAEYPVKMQKMIAERSWFESFDIKRVIVREGHVPMCFYFLLSGSAVVSTMENDTARTVMFLNRGDSFGDVAILNNSRRQTTVISREKIELLCMSDTDFTDIFMSGGIRDPDDPFLKSIHFLNGWPRQKLIEHPKKCIFSYFKRGTVLVADSSKNDWIFVIKSGSASILKKLQTVDVRRVPKKERPRDLRDEVLDHMKHERYLSHEEQMQLMFEEEKRSVEDQNLHVRFYALPEINIKTNESYNELRNMKEEFLNANSVNRALGSLEKMADAGVDVKSEIANSDSTMAPSKRSSRRKSVANVLLKGPFMLKSSSGATGRENSFYSASSRRGSTRNSRRGSGEDQKVEPQEDSADTYQLSEENKRKVDDWQGMSLPSVAESPLNDLRITKAEPKPVFVEVQNLTKGQIFGMTEMLFDNQPHFSLVSNGMECIMIEKKFFLEHANQALMVRLRESTYPYPSDEALQENLESQIRWDHQKKLFLSNQLREVKIKKSDKNDSRCLLQIPAAHRV